jgi:toxin-antitoxin system, toxin component, relE family
MYEIEYTNSFKRSFKKCLKRGLDSHVFEAALRILVEKGSLPQTISLISYRGSIVGFGNVTYNLIGY